MRPASSYQSPSMTPPDDYDVAVDDEGNEIRCGEKNCGDHAMEQDMYDMPLCPAHLRMEVDYDRADRMRDEAKYDREYGQYETDGTTG